MQTLHFILFVNEGHHRYGRYHMKTCVNSQAYQRVKRERTSILWLINDANAGLHKTE